MSSLGARTSPIKVSARTGFHHPDRVLAVAVLLVAVAAWCWLAYGHDTHPTPTGQLPTTTGHGHGPGVVGEGLSPSAIRLGGWSVMVLAMMLPPALPLVLSLRQVTRRRRTSLGLTALGTAAFIAPWIAAGALLIVLDLALGTATPTGAWLADHPQLVAGSAAIVAGAYQFTPLKRACLTACRSPRQLVLTEWHGREPSSDVTRIGLRYGLVCVGCCWALMLLTLAVGWPALSVMVVLSAAMAAERLLPRVRPLVPGIALLAIALGIALLVGIVPAGLIVGGSL